MEELKTNLLASGLDEKTTKDIISKLKGDTTKIYFTKESFEKELIQYLPF